MSRARKRTKRTQSSWKSKAWLIFKWVAGLAMAGGLVIGFTLTYTQHLQEVDSKSAGNVFGFSHSTFNAPVTFPQANTPDHTEEPPLQVVPSQAPPVRYSPLPPHDRSLLGRPLAKSVKVVQSFWEALEEFVGVIQRTLTFSQN